MSSKQTTLPSRSKAIRKRAGRLPRLSWVVAGIFVAGLLGWLLYRTPGAPTPRTGAEVAQAHPAGPPWRHGPADARFTLTLYADLECPFCKAYYPTLMAWIDAHPEASLQWHHLPLAMHDPEASRLARVAECAGEAQGHEAFFGAIAWLYQNTRGDGQGLPTDQAWPGLTTARRACLDSDRPAAIVRAQADEAVRSGINATPTVRLDDGLTGKSLLLHGPIEGDALLSALDLVASEETVGPKASESPKSGATLTERRAR
ncbi:thioredoxin domain-containing protein [Pseudomonas aeruginosa]|jgi:protein-disulfide isomerase|uniref:DsbA family protein n=1 Tax=Pseudomonas paraeruginosa TaxID=2994495 RepID=UPI001C3ECA36|nr:DsbA family protein [Pseudomonas aeruginosa]MBV6325971.1 DsbA family protein [Pseudomonas aeruginosa]MDI3608564.1 thioredoxin domain-containing protein [Pseudomonas aeruginosa]MDI3675241.1 thioredoxin domain-containing protein [Pseudomonas aeruginosa]MDI3705785.1 thioredoxin domain-containing protein [Pseudomonas aeruginosa]